MTAISAPAGIGVHEITNGSVTSRDGTRIGYRRVGRGPGLVILHGAMSSGLHHSQLAEALADDFTVYLPDRRGRGLSIPSTGDSTVRSNVDDLDAILQATGARDVFAVSSGAVVLLEAALELPQIQRIGIFEPPLFRDTSRPKAVLARVDRDLEGGRPSAALVTGMLAIEMGPPIFRLVPRPLLEAMVGRFVAAEAKKPRGEYLTMGTLAPTLHDDFAVVAEASGGIPRYRDIRAEALLLGCSKSPAFLKAALEDLCGVLPNARRVELAGVGHDVVWNADLGGQPELVADELRQFFAPQAAS